MGQGAEWDRRAHPLPPRELPGDPDTRQSQEHPGGLLGWNGPGAEVAPPPQRPPLRGRGHRACGQLGPGCEHPH